MSEQREQKFDLLENNANAVRAVMAAVESTIGPKGLDTMLVDQFGNVVITNDGDYHFGYDGGQSSGGAHVDSCHRRAAGGSWRRHRLRQR